MKNKSLLNSSNQIYFASLGCARNLVDSEVMIGQLIKAGYELTPEQEKADFLIVNTCGFLESARQEALEVIEEFFMSKKPKAKVIAVGCMVQKKEKLLREKFPKIHALLGSGDAEKIVEAVQSAVSKDQVSNQKSYLQLGEVPRFVSTPSNYAYLKIAEGCKKQCSFCIIPSIKGKLKSKPVAQVVKEFTSLLSQGVKEVILIAQDLGDYGKDFSEKVSFSSLLKELLRVPGDYWIRLLYLYPDEVNDELIQVMSSDSRICPYVDMPIQHINDEILQKMHRKTNKKQIYQIINKLRAKIPKIAIRTSLMVGFPGETEEQFEELLSFVKEVKLSHIGVFTYSKEEEAYSAKLEGHLPFSIKEKRQKKLLETQLKIAKKQNEKLIGSKEVVVVDGTHPDSPYLLQARSQKQCPEIDGCFILNDFAQIPETGNRFEVEITGYSDYDLIAKVLRPIYAKKREKLTIL